MTNKRRVPKRGLQPHVQGTFNPNPNPWMGGGFTPQLPVIQQPYQWGPQQQDLNQSGFLNPDFNAGNYGVPFNSQPQVVAPVQMNRAYNGPQHPNYVQPGGNSWVNQPWYNPQSTQPMYPQQVMHPGNHQVLHQMNPQFLQPQVHLRQPIAPQSYANNTYFNQPASVPQPGLLQQPVVMEADQDVTVDLGGLVLSDE